ncbi:hypothetical protein T492DRAFT_898919 [Pavlovales sp. CCMP2436]|nr:hypothetical protein T492DRAFT_898919 [Pavlovales sp. CCMP2436]
MAQQWTGVFHRSHPFELAAAEQMQKLKGCISNDYYHYISNSLYGVHLRRWLFTFQPEQFLFLETEFLLLETELMKVMSASDLLALVASHVPILQR